MSDKVFVVEAEPSLTVKTHRETAVDAKRSLYYLIKILYFFIHMLFYERFICAIHLHITNKKLKHSGGYKDSFLTAD